MSKIEKSLSKNQIIAGICIVIFVVIFSFVGPWFAAYGEYEITYIKDGIELTENASISEKGVTINSFAKPSAAHPLGTDKEGRDILTRLMYGGRISVSVAFFTIIIEGVFGTFLGLMSGYFGKITDEIIMRFVDFVSCIPDFPLILILSALTTSMGIEANNKIYFIVLLIAFFGAMKIARVVRGQVRYILEQDYILAATAAGIGTLKKIVRHILPNVLPQIIVLSSLGIGSVILTESALSFLGFGLPYPYASWGNMVNAVSDPQILTNHPNVFIMAGVMIFVTTLAFNLIGDGLDDLLNPMGRKSR